VVERNTGGVSSAFATGAEGKVVDRGGTSETTRTWARMWFSWCAFDGFDRADQTHFKPNQTQRTRVSAMKTGV
jgi:hypothetical protein